MNSVTDTNHPQSGAGAPKCKLCQKNHWLRDGCDGRLQDRFKNTTREGHDVLKGAKPTSSPATARPDPTSTKKRAKRRKRKAKKGARKT